MVDTPVLFLLFNRPDTTTLVFDAIRKVKPTKFFIAADGPRKNKDGEAELCKKTRDLVLNGIDWDCEVQTLFREENLGCGKAVSEAITWFFEHVEEGIILEDDTLPNPTFFIYCTEMLNRYRYNEQVMCVSGNTFHSFSSKKAVHESYYFSSYPFMWGWATWKRAWSKYQFEIIKNSPSTIRNGWLEKVFTNAHIKKYWQEFFIRAEVMDVNFTWDYQWFLVIWKYSGLTILPQRNLVSNIGFGNNATHTVEEDHRMANLKSYKFSKKIKHPSSVIKNEKLEWINFKNVYLPYKKPLFSRIKKRLKSISMKIFKHMNGMYA